MFHDCDSITHNFQQTSLHWYSDKTYKKQRVARYYISKEFVNPGLMKNISVFAVFIEIEMKTNERTFHRVSWHDTDAVLFCREFILRTNKSRARLRCETNFTFNISFWFNLTRSRLIENPPRGVHCVYAKMFYLISIN